MKHKAKLFVLGLLQINLCSCMVDNNENSYVNYQPSSYDNSMIYSGTNYSPDTAYQATNMEQSVSVPNSYHVGEYHSPVSFKDRDKSWVIGQNSQGYTIEIAEGDKASQVAQKLYQTPKNDRMAQIKYQENGKAYYKGVYGTYPDAESAQKALNSLPDEVKKGASVKNWGVVQQNLD